MGDMKKTLLFFLFSLITIWGNTQTYYVYVAAESEDEVALISFDGKDAHLEQRIPVGYIPKEIEGPHGIAVDMDGKHWYLSMAHGNPYGYLYKYSTSTNELVGKTTLGLFPATMQQSKITGMIYIVNFNLHGDMVPSTVSVVDPKEMIELKRIETGVMPHGSRISPNGRWHYSLAMMSGELFEIDALRMDLNRTLNLDLKAGFITEEELAKIKEEESKHEGHEGHENMYHSTVKPTWVIPHPSLRKAYVAGNGCDEIFEIDLEKWDISRRFETGKGPYNVEVSPNGKYMVSTYKSEGYTGIWNLETGKELVRIPNTRKVCHGITITPDSKYAFVSVEGIGGEPGTVDIISLERLEKVDFVEIGKQAGGIAFWKMEDK